MCLDRKSIAIFRSINRDSKGITDSPNFYLKKLSQENPPQDLIENWKQLIKKIPSEEIKQILTSEFFQMYAKRSPKYPLELAQELTVPSHMPKYAHGHQNACPFALILSRVLRYALRHQNAQPLARIQAWARNCTFGYQNAHCILYFSCSL